MELVKADKSMARDLAQLINIAGEGVPFFIWSQMARNNESTMDIGEARAARDDGDFSYRNAKVLVNEGEILGMLLGYQLPLPYTLGELDEYPSVIRPLIELESFAAGSFYINALATYEKYRGRGVAKTLMVAAESLALENRYHDLSLIVCSENIVAMTMYEKMGFFALQTREVVSFPGASLGGDWVLMMKNLV